MKIRLFTVLLALSVVSSAICQTIIIEPDNYTNGMVLDHIVPQVSLITAGSDDLPIPPVSFDVTANYDPSHFTSTGTNVFGQANVQFWNTNRRLRMDFTAPVSSVAIDFIGGDLFANDVGQLDVFNSSGGLIGSYVTGPKPPGAVETMSVSRSVGDIAWAVAYLPGGDGSFGRLDHLEFVVVPEPACATLVVFGGVILASSRVRRAILRRSLRCNIRSPKGEIFGRIK